MNFFDMDSGCHFGPWFLIYYCLYCFASAKLEETKS